MHLMKKKNAFVLFGATLIIVCFCILVILKTGDAQRTDQKMVPIENRLPTKTNGGMPQAEQKSLIEMVAIVLPWIVVFGLIDYVIYAKAKRRIDSVYENTQVSNQVKLKQIENEDVVFDLPLYVGLLGTVLGFLLVACGWSFASRIAAYISTIIGIVVSALMRVLMLRPTRAKLLETKDE